MRLFVQTAYSDADMTARVLQAVAPVGCKLYQTEVATLPKAAPT